MKLALGPILYYWPRERVFAFYEDLLAAPLDIVYLGEAVCARRHELRLNDWLDLAERFAAAGKEVVLSTQVLIESESDLKMVRKLADNQRFALEANDMAAVHRVAGNVPFVAGPLLNVYNGPALKLFAELGAKRWVMPLEMGRDGLTQLQSERPAGLETELFAYGRLPLAFSARCFTARHDDLPKDDCRFSCLAHPDGLLLNTREGQPFLVLNGIQTQSAQVYNLVSELAVMRQLGVDVVRISPQFNHTPEVVELFGAVLTQQATPEHAMRRITELMPGEACNGYWHGKPGLEQTVP